MSFEQGYALIIGVGRNRRDSRLDVPKVHSDADVLESVLCDPMICGYRRDRVIKLTEGAAERKQILDALDALITNVATQDTVLLFYAGHGMFDSNEVYHLTTFDTIIRDNQLQSGTGISESELLEKLRAIRAERLLIIINSCHSGSIAPSLDGDPTDVGLGAKAPPSRLTSTLLSSGKGRAILTACQEHQKSYLGREDQTIFTSALIKGLKGHAGGKNGYIELGELYNYLYTEITSAVPEQEPVLTLIKNVGSFPVARLVSTTQQIPPPQPAPKPKLSPQSEARIQRLKEICSKSTISRENLEAIYQHLQKYNGLLLHNTSSLNNLVDMIDALVDQLIKVGDTEDISLIQHFVGFIIKHYRQFSVPDQLRNDLSNWLNRPKDPVPSILIRIAPDHEIRDAFTVTAWSIPIDTRKIWESSAAVARNELPQTIQACYREIFPEHIAGLGGDIRIEFFLPLALLTEAIHDYPISLDEDDECECEPLCHLHVVVVRSYERSFPQNRSWLLASAEWKNRWKKAETQQEQKIYFVRTPSEYTKITLRLQDTYTYFVEGCNPSQPEFRTEAIKRLLKTGIPIGMWFDHNTTCENEHYHIPTQRITQDTPLEELPEKFTKDWPDQKRPILFYDDPNRLPQECSFTPFGG